MDGIAAVDWDRSQLLSYVHMSAKANQWVAQAFCDVPARGRYVDDWVAKRGATARHGR